MQSGPKSAGRVFVEASLASMLGAVVACSSTDTNSPGASDGSIDQGSPDALVTTDGTPYVLYGPAPMVDSGLPAADAASVDSGMPDAATDAMSACDASGYAIYGPRGCSTNADCASQGDAGFVCNVEAGVTDPCGNFKPWPVCEAPADAGDSGPTHVPDSGAAD